MDDDFMDSNESSFPLFSVAALKSSGQQGFLNSLLPPSDTINLLPRHFPSADKIEEALAPIKKKRGRKAIPKISKKTEDPEITLKEIIEDQRSGLPTEEEAKNQKERIAKMHKKRAENRDKKKQQASLLANSDDHLETTADNTKPSIEGNFIINGTSSSRMEDSSNPGVPRIIIKDGKPILDTSNVISNLKDNSKELTLADNKKAARVTSMSFRKKNHTEKWSDDETRRFFKAIEIFGSDFSMVTKLFPTRNRGQIKNKFRKEEKESAGLMEQAFKKHKVLSKRSIMREFTKSIASGEQLNFTLSNTNIELNRNFSKSSIDSMDIKVRTQIQDIFNNEIQINNKAVLNRGKDQSLDVEPLQKESSRLSLSDIGDGEFKIPNFLSAFSIKVETPLEAAITKETKDNRANNLLLSLIKD